MHRYLQLLLTSTCFALLAPFIVLAQDEEAPPPREPPSTTAAETEPEITPAELLDPYLLTIIEHYWGPVESGGPTVTNSSNVTILSVPDACAIYMASVDEIRDVEKSIAGEVAVEDVVFRDEHYLGIAPLTAEVPTGDYVLAVRAMVRISGFDLGCVQKITSDVITGGQRYSYHLYPIRKRAGQYQCFIANFSGPGSTEEEIGLELLERGTFWIDEEVLAEALAGQTNAPEDERLAIADRLNQLGVAFYRSGNQDFLVKLTIAGNSYKIEEELVE